LITTLLVEFEDTAVSNGDGDPIEGSLYAVSMDCDTRHATNYAYGPEPAKALTAIATQVPRTALKGTAARRAVVVQVAL